VGRTTNKARREQQAATAREKAAVARAEQQRADQRRRAITILGAVVAIAVLGAAIALVALTHKGKQSATGDRKAVPASVMKDIESVSPATMTAVGAGATDPLLPKKITDPPLTANGKPQVLFIGAEFCPHCAAERWPLIQALSRFGTFSNLSMVSSSSTDEYPNTPTFSFYKSGYTSKYLDFTSVEDEDRSGNQLESPTAAEGKLWVQHTGNPPSFPFVDYGGKFIQTSESYNPQSLAGKTQAQIASQLNDPTNSVTKSIVGSANVTTAAICTLTNNQPSSVCLTPTITNIQSELGG
jgi:Domain of unknown function (DUF929)